jgi:hypothetical protein
LRKLIFAVAALAALTFALRATAAPTPADKHKAVTLCKQLRSTIGVPTFRAVYVTKKRSRTFAKCRRTEVRIQDAIHRGATAECKAERDANAEAFKQKYGVGPLMANGFGHCVSGKIGAGYEARKKFVVEATKQCRKLRRQRGKAFKARYGKQHTAFAKCVSRTVRSLEAKPPAPDTPFSSS